MFCLLLKGKWKYPKNRQRLWGPPLRYKHFCFIVVLELVMPVVIFPCCGDISLLVKTIITRIRKTLSTFLTMVVLWSSASSSQSFKK